MNLEVYMMIAFSGFIILAAGIIKKSYVLCFLSAILFLPVSIGGMDFDYIDCDLGISQTNAAGNITTFTSGFTCVEHQLSYPELAWFFGGMIVLAIVIGLVIILHNTKFGRGSDPADMTRD